MVWMTGGASFTNRSGSSTGTAAQDFSPSDVGLAAANGWVQLDQTKYPSLLDVPENGQPTLVGGMYQTKLFQSNLPLIVAPTGSMGNNGVLTGGTALVTGYYGGPTWQYFPASAIVSGSAAGWYYTVMSSTTAGIVYNHVLSSGLPYIPGTPVAFATTGPGAFTGVTTAVAALTFTIPANTMGPNGSCEFNFMLGSSGGNTNNHTYTIKVGSSTIFSYVDATSANKAFYGSVLWSNTGQTGKQIAQTAGTLGAITNVPTFTTIDTTADQTVTVNITTATATDWSSIDSFQCFVTPG